MAPLRYTTTSVVLTGLHPEIAVDPGFETPDDHQILPGLCELWAQWTGEPLHILATRNGDSEEAQYGRELLIDAGLGIGRDDLVQKIKDNVVAPEGWIVEPFGEYSIRLRLVTPQYE